MNISLSGISFLGIVILYLSSGLEAKVCGKYHKNGPCSLIQTPLQITTKTTPAQTTTTTTPVPSILVVLCLVACDQGRESVFNMYCKCIRNSGPASNITVIPTNTSITATPTMTIRTTTQTTTRNTTTLTTGTTTETTTMPEESTTLPRWLNNLVLETCYYTRNRPAKAVSTRIYSGTVAVDCNYPGVVGVYNATSLKFLCMGVLLEERTIMIDTFCKSLVSNSLSYAYIAAYKKPTDFSNLPTIVASTARLLDPTKSNTKVYTVSLSKPIDFDSACVQPACLPNNNISLSNIDLNDCRIVGYGDTSNTFGSPSSALLEIAVKVDATTIAPSVLKYTRTDGKSSRTGPCFNDQGAPLICNYMPTGEWITVGVVTSVGLKCNEGLSSAPAITSLLKESTNYKLYEGLQHFKYVSNF